MSIRPLALAVCLGLALPASVPAFAAPPAKAAEVTDKDVARSVDFGGLVFPVFAKDGRLLNYLFVNARIMVGPGKDPWKYREKAHFIRDAMIRASHRTSFGMEGSPGKLNEALAAAECLKAANQAVGEANALVEMTFTQIASQSS
jgi:hypothetical protein